MQTAVQKRALLLTIFTPVGNYPVGFSHCLDGSIPVSRCFKCHMSPLGGLGLNLLVKPDTCSSGSAKAYVSVLSGPFPHSIPWLSLKVSLGSNPS